MNGYNNNGRKLLVSFNLDPKYNHGNNYFLTRISALVKEMGGNVFRNYEF